MIGRMNTDLTGRVAIITGAASPTGAAVARTLAASGARVALADLNPDRIAALAAEIRAAGGEAIDIAADVASKFQCVTIVETTRAEWGRLDILVNATIVRPSVSLIKMDEWEWARCLDVNLKGTFLMCQLVGRVMADENIGRADESIGRADENAGRGGTILILAEGAADAPGAPLNAAPQNAAAQNAAYAASMAGLTGFAAACAAEYGPMGIEVRLVGRAELEAAFS
jgi:NAD(P)-dependent dehydrogenase (short-subunit alcohol dehydrogenase family)